MSIKNELRDLPIIPPYLVLNIVLHLDEFNLRLMYSPTQISQLGRAFALPFFKNFSTSTFIVIVLSCFIKDYGIKAQTHVWNRDANATWGTAANWDNATIPNTTDAVVHLTNDLTSNYQVRVNSDQTYTLGHLLIGDPDGSHRHDLVNQNAGSNLIFDVSNGSASITKNDGSIALTLSARFTLEDDIIITNNSSTSLTINSLINTNGKTIYFEGSGQIIIGGGITGSGGIVNNMTGKLRINSALSFTGGFVQNSGNLDLNNSSSLGDISSVFTIYGGELCVSSGSLLTLIDYPIIISNSFDFSPNINRSLHLGNGLITLTNDVTITSVVSGRTLTLGGELIAPNRQITLLGPGRVSFGDNDKHLEDLIIETNAHFTATSGVFKISNSIDRLGSGIFVHNNGTVDYVSPGNLVIPRLNYFNLTSSVAEDRTFQAAEYFISGTVIPANGNWITNGSTINYNGTSNESIPTSFTYDNLTFSGTSGTKTFDGDLIVQNNLRIAGANTVSLNHTTIKKTHTINNLTMTTGTIDGGSQDVIGDTITSELIVLGNINKSNSAASIISSAPSQPFAIIIAGGGTQTMNNLGTLSGFKCVIENASTLSLNTAFRFGGYSGTALVVGENCFLTGNNNQIFFDSPNMHVDVFGWVRTQREGGLIGSINSLFHSDNLPTLSLKTGSTVEYNRNGGQSVSARDDYFNLLFSGNNNKDLAGNSKVFNVTIESSTFRLTGSTLTVNGNWQRNNGGFTHGNGLIIFEGTSLQTINHGVGTFSAFTVNNPDTVRIMGNNLTVPGNVTILAGVLDANNFNINLSASWLNNARFISGTGTVRFTSNSSGRTISGNLSGVNAFWNLHCDGSGGVWAITTACEVKNDVLLTNGTLVNPNILTVRGNWTRNGSGYTGTGGTVIFDGGGILQMIGGSSATGFVNLEIAENALVQTNNASTASGSFTMKEKAYYIHNGVAQIPGGTRTFFNTGSKSEMSTLEIRKSSGNLSPPLANYGNLHVNCDNYTSVINASANLRNVAGNLKISNTNGQIFTLVTTNNNTHNIGGNIEIEGASTQVCVNTITGSPIINIGDSLIIRDGSFDISTGNGTPTLSISKDLILENGSFLRSSTNGNAIIRLVGNLFNTNGTIQLANTRLELLNNTTDQTFNSDNTISLGQLTLNKSNNELHLNTHLTIQSNVVLTSGKINLSNNTLTLNTDSFSRTSGSIDASTSGSTVVFGNSNSVSLPVDFFQPGIFHHLTLNGHTIAPRMDWTINGILNLNNNNQDETNGLLDMVIAYDTYADARSSNSTNANNNFNSHILTLNPLATVTGTGDVTGKIRRNNFVDGATYAFGNANMTLKFEENGGTLPSQITVLSSRGAQGLHVDKDGISDFTPNTDDTLIGGVAVKRLWQILRTGGSSQVRFSVRFPYEDSELNGNPESDLVTWDHHIPYGGMSPHEHGKTSNNITENYVELINHGLFYLAEEGDTEFTKYWMLAKKETQDNLWLGAVNSSWNIPSNWTNGIIPDDNNLLSIVFNDAVYRDTIELTGDQSALAIEIKPNAVFNGNSGTLRLKGGPLNNNGVGTWIGQGNFIPGTSTVIFDYDEATISGQSKFHKLQIANGKKLTPQANAVLEIEDELIIDGILDAAANVNEFIFSGNGKNIPEPNGLIRGYSKLNIHVPNGQIALSERVRVVDTLKMTSGVLNTSSTNILEIGNGINRTAKVAYQGGTIVGPMRRWYGTSASSDSTNGIFPVGTEDRIRYAIINFNEETSGGYIETEYKTGTPTVLDENDNPLDDPFNLPITFMVNGKRNYIQNADATGYWDITPYDENGVAYGALDNDDFSITLRLNSNSIDNNPITANPPAMRVIRAKGNPSSAHEPFEVASTNVQIQTFNAGTDYAVKVSSLTGFSWFNIGGDNSTPLPVELMSLTANCTENGKLIQWKTSSENQSAYFDVEQSTNGTYWRSIHQKNAAGFSTQLLNYEFLDQQNLNGPIYYRLKQFDVDGSFNVYGPIMVDCDEEDSEHYFSFPNPSNEGFNLYLKNNQSGKVNIKIHNSLGQLVLMKTIEVMEGSHILPLDFQINKGVYQIELIDSRNQYRRWLHVVNG
jgi:hypothetical protein